MQRCALCRSRREQRAFTIYIYLLAQFGVDTAENGPLKVCQKIVKKTNLRKARKNIGQHRLGETYERRADLPLFPLTLAGCAIHEFFFLLGFFPPHLGARFCVGSFPHCTSICAIIIINVRRCCCSVSSAHFVAVQCLSYILFSDTFD